MTVVFVVCAAVGATVLVLQFLLSLVGLGGEHDFSGGDHDFGAGETDHEISTGEAHGDAAHAGPAAEHETNAQPHDASAGQAAQGSTWLFQVLSLRTIVAALAFFGLAGLAAQAAHCRPFSTLLIASTAGLGAMYAVYAMLRSMRSLQAEGTARIHRAVGEQATVYLRIPAQPTGRRKNPDQPPEPHHGIPGDDHRRRDSQRGRGRRHPRSSAPIPSRSKPSPSNTSAPNRRETVYEAARSMSELAMAFDLETSPQPSSITKEPPCSTRL